VKDFTVWWSPEGRPIAIVRAKTARAACRKAPQPYRKYLGELYATEEVDERLEKGPHDYRRAS
jgi:hypothetical protein